MKRFRVLKKISAHTLLNEGISDCAFRMVVAIYGKMSIFSASEVIKVERLCLDAQDLATPENLKWLKDHGFIEEIKEDITPVKEGDLFTGKQYHYQDYQLALYPLDSDDDYVLIRINSSQLFGTPGIIFHLPEGKRTLEEINRIIRSLNQGYITLEKG